MRVKTKCRLERGSGGEGEGRRTGREETEESEKVVVKTVPSNVSCKKSENGEKELGGVEGWGGRRGTGGEVWGSIG